MALVAAYSGAASVVRCGSLGALGAPFFIRDTYFFNLLWFRLRAAMQPQVRSYYADMAEAYQEGEPLKRFLRKLDNLQDICSTYKVDLRVAIFPFLHNLGPDYPFAPAHRKVLDHCREWRLLDLLRLRVLAERCPSHNLRLRPVRGIQAGKTDEIRLLVVVNAITAADCHLAITLRIPCESKTRRPIKKRAVDATLGSFVAAALHEAFKRIAGIWHQGAA